jgi:hypothetical protein
MDKITIRFNREKETKNTVRFAEEKRDGQPPIVGTLYVSKSTANNCATLDVTITPVL